MIDELQGGCMVGCYGAGLMVKGRLDLGWITTKTVGMAFATLWVQHAPLIFDNRIWESGKT